MCGAGAGELLEIDLVGSLQLAHALEDCSAEVGPVRSAFCELGPPVLGAQLVDSLERVFNLAQHHQGSGARELTMSCGQGLVAVVHPRPGESEELERIPRPPLVGRRAPSPPRPPLGSQRSPPSHTDASVVKPVSSARRAASEYLSSAAWRCPSACSRRPAITRQRARTPGDSARAAPSSASVSA